MLVHELISQLLKMPQEVMVLVEGYEGGFNEVLGCLECNSSKLPNNSWWHGDYVQDENGDMVAVRLTSTREHME